LTALSKANPHESLDDFTFLRDGDIIEFVYLMGDDRNRENSLLEYRTATLIIPRVSQLTMGNVETGRKEKACIRLSTVLKCIV
jgi:hypothetical protein